MWGECLEPGGLRFRNRRQFDGGGGRSDFERRGRVLRRGNYREGVATRHNAGRSAARKTRDEPRVRDVLAGLGFVFCAFGIPYLLSQAARTRRQRAAQKTLLPVKTELSCREPMRTKRRGVASIRNSTPARAAAGPAVGESATRLVRPIAARHLICYIR